MHCYVRKCPHGFRDHGLYCGKPKAYGRGAGYALWDKNKCFRKHRQGCEKHGALYYPRVQRLSFFVFLFFFFLSKVCVFLCVCVCFFFCRKRCDFKLCPCLLYVCVCVFCREMFACDSLLNKKYVQNNKNKHKIHFDGMHFFCTPKNSVDVVSMLLVCDFFLFLYLCVCVFTYLSLYGK